MVVLRRQIVRDRRQVARRRASGQRAQCIFEGIELLSNRLFMFALPVDPRVIKAYEKQTDSFQKAAALFEQPIEILRIPYENTTLPGYFIKADASNTTRKTLLCTGGYDGTCEELFFSIASGALERGYNVLIFDGPGQGGALVIQKLPMRPDWENVVTPVVDCLLKRSDVDSARIALYGGSFRG